MRGQSVRCQEPLRGEKVVEGLRAIGSRVNSAPGFQPLSFPLPLNKHLLSPAHGSAKGIVLMPQRRPSIGGLLKCLDIAAVTAYRNFITRMADALGAELTEDYKKLRRDYVQSLMVGKQLL